jgi:hypothetical protein
MRCALHGREHSNWVIATDLDDEQIWRAIQHGVADESILVTLVRQLPYEKWSARDHYGRWLIVADEHLVREWQGVLPD